MLGQGVVQRHSEKPWRDKTFYSFTLSGQEGWFSTGVKRPPAIGTSVKFNYKLNNAGYNNVDGSIEIVAEQEAGPIRSVASTVTASAKSGEGGNQAYWHRKESRDVANDAARELGATRNTALQLIDLMLKYEAIVLPASKAKKEEVFLAIFDRYTKLLLKKEIPEEVKVEENAQVEGNTEKSDEDWT